MQIRNTDTGQRSGKQRSVNKSEKAGKRGRHLTPYISANDACCLEREVSRAEYLDVLCDTAPEHVGSGLVQQRPFQQTGVLTWMRLSDGCYLTRYLSSRSAGPLRGIRGLSLAELARLAHRAFCWVWLALAGMDEVLLFLLVDLQVGVSLGAELGSFDVVLESP